MNVFVCVRVCCVNVYVCVRERVCGRSETVSHMRISVLGKKIYMDIVRVHVYCLRRG